MKFFSTSLIAGLIMFAHVTGEGASVQKTAKQFISEFQNGIRFAGSETVDGIAPNKHVMPAIFFLLAKALGEGTSSVREDIVRLLEKLGLYLDSPGPDKLAIIRDRSIIKMLLVEGFAKDDSASSATAGIVRDRCTPGDLALFHEIYLKSLRKLSGDYLYIVAKAKTMQARSLVENLAQLPAWKDGKDNELIIKVAQAALGSTKVEDEFIDAVEEAEKSLPPAPLNRFFDVGDAKDGKDLAEKLAILGYIGTPKSLTVLCSYLRSPIKTYVPNIKERSIRYYALDAIRYNFPDERILLRPIHVGEWAAAENFCTRHIGFAFNGPTPDLPRDKIYPTRMFLPTK